MATAAGLVVQVNHGWVEIKRFGENTFGAVSAEGISEFGLLEQLTFPQFNASSEEELDAWADEVAAVIRSKATTVDPAKVCMTVRNLLPRGIQQLIAHHPPSEYQDDPEKLLDLVAVTQFQNWTYLLNCMRQLYEYQVGELPTIHSVVDNKVSAFIRADRRRGAGALVNWPMVLHAIQRLLPPECVDLIEEEARGTLMQRLKMIEFRMQRRRELIGVYNVDVPKAAEAQSEAKKARQDRDEAMSRPSAPKECTKCGGTHEKGNCPAREIYCRACQQKGHFARKCPTRMVPLPQGGKFAITQKARGGDDLKVSGPQSKADLLDRRFNELQWLTDSLRF